MGKNLKLIVKTPKGSVVQVKTPNGTMTARLEWNDGFGAKMTNQLQTGQEKFDMEVMKQMEPYMQLDSGAMIQSMRLSTDVGSGRIRVNTPYATNVYHSKSKVGRKTGRLRGPYYFDRMKADKQAYLQYFITKVTGAE